MIPTLESQREEGPWFAGQPGYEVDTLPEDNTEGFWNHTHTCTRVCTQTHANTCAHTHTPKIKERNAFVICSTLVLLSKNGLLSFRFLRVSGMKHHDQKQLGEERVYVSHH